MRTTPLPSPIPVPEGPLPRTEAALPPQLFLRIEGAGIGKGAAAPAVYGWAMFALISAVALCLLTLVDARRGFLFPQYALRTPYMVFSPYHTLMLGLGVVVLAGGIVFLRRYEARFDLQRLEGHVRILALVLVGLLIADLFLYRGIAAATAVQAGSVNASWLEAFGVTGLLRPLALATSYMLNVWHATFLGVLLAGLVLTVLPRYLKPFFSRTGLGGSLFGSLFALPQPFCSCCAAVIVPSYLRQGASTSFSLAFVVGSPMLNITGLLLSAALLPGPLAATRIFAGLLLTIPVTYAVTWLAERWGTREDQGTPGMVERWLSKLVDFYCRIFHLEEIVRSRPIETPSAFLSTWALVSLRIAALLVPTLFFLTLFTAAVIQVLPAAFGNNPPSVLLAAVVGTLMMISTWSEIPVAQQMIAAGYSGPAAAMLVALPPVSLPCLMLLGGSTGNFRITALLGLSVMAVSVAAGMVFL